MCLAQRHNTVTLVGFEPRPSRFGVRRSTTTPPRSLRIWTDSDTRSRTIPLREHSYPVRANHKKPANYDGTSSFQDYLVQFNMTGDLNCWDERTKAMELATSLRGAAQTVLSDLRPEQRTDFNQLISALTARFEPTNQTELYRAQIKGWLRKKSETVQ